MNAAGGLTAMATEVAAPASMPGGPGADSSKSSPNTSLLATSKDGLPQFGSTLLASAWPELTAQPVSPLRSPEIATSPKAEKRGIETQTVAEASIAPVPVQLMVDPVGEDSPPSAGGRLAPLDSQGLPGAATQELALNLQAASLGGSAVPAASDRVLAELGGGVLASSQPPEPGLFQQLSESSPQAPRADSKAEASESKLPTAAYKREGVGEDNAILFVASAVSPTISASPLQEYASLPVVTLDRVDRGPGAAGEGHAPAISSGSLQGASSSMTPAEVSAASLDPVASLPAARLLTVKETEAVESDKSHGSSHGSPGSTTTGSVGSALDSEQAGRSENGSASQLLVAAAPRFVSGGSPIDAENVTPCAPMSPTLVGSNSASARGAAGPARSAAALPGSPGANAQPMATPGAVILHAGGVPHAGSAMQAEIMPGSSVERSPGDTTAGELLTHMDSGGTVSASGVRLSPHAVEVGIEDPAHGWIEVRAQGVAGQVTASLNADSADARAALHAQLPGMAQYLAEHDLGVRDLGVSAGVSSGFTSPGHSGDTSFGGGPGGFGGGAGSFSGSASHADPGTDSGQGRGPGSARPPSPVESRTTQRGGSGQASDSSGHLISVRV